MVYFITASKDASVYLQQPIQNTGIDNVLEIGKVYYGNIKDISRALLKFDISHLSHSISLGDVSVTDVKLILRETQSEEIPLNYTIYAHPVSQSWEMGIGQRYDDITTAGVTWRYRDGDSESEWLPNGEFATISNSLPYIESSFISASVTTTYFESGPVYVYGSDSYEYVSTGSYSGYGGVWYVHPSASQQFQYQTADIYMDVKPILLEWVSGSIENNGIILKYSSEFENNTSDYGIMKYFSKETHTIYQPKLCVQWDDQIYNTGSFSVLSSDEIKVGISNLKSEYKLGTSPVFKVFGRERYPLKTFADTFQYDITEVLSEYTYYQIKDYLSDDIIIPFSDYSKVSCGTDGNYFRLNLSNWESGRTYKIEFKTVINDNTIYFDDNLTFKIVKG